MNQEFINHIEGMLHSPVRNYIIPGLTSWLLGDGEQGRVRAFSCEREHHESIVPHSHRYDFQCLVLRGNVHNIEWIKSDSDHADSYKISMQQYHQEIGGYTIESIEKTSNFISLTSMYFAGQSYGMPHHAIHSIRFSKDSLVLFFEGKTKKNFSYFLEPYVNGKAVPTAQVRDWMFDRA